MSATTLPECPGIFTLRFARELLSALGADINIIRDNWCWANFREPFSSYQEKVEAYFANAKTGDPAFAAFCMVYSCGSFREWAEKIIETSQIGNPAYSAYRMVYSCGSSREWAEKVIEESQIGNPASAANCMAYYFGSSLEWARKVEQAQKARASQSSF